MPGKRTVWLNDPGLYSLASQAITRGEISQPLPTSVHSAKGLTLRLIENLDRISAGDTDILLDTRYDALQDAAESGWRTIWFNPTSTLAPEVLPIQDADLLDAAQLPEAVQGLQEKPTLAQCLAWWEDWALPENVRRHSITVSRSAYALAVGIRQKGIALDPILTHRGGLLHDIDKIQTLKLAGAHGQKGADFLEGEGYPALAEIVREHIMSTILEPGADDRRWEVKLVYFCDKLVEGDQLVPFDRRLAALYQRYPHYQETMARSANPVWKLNEQICSILSIPNHENLISTLSKLQYN